MLCNSTEEPSHHARPGKGTWADPSATRGCQDRPQGDAVTAVSQGTPAPVGWQGWSHLHPGTVTPGLRHQRGSAAALMPAPKAWRCTCYECKRPPIASSNQLRSCKQLMNLKFLPGVDPGDTGMKWQAHQTEIASCSRCMAC